MDELSRNRVARLVSLAEQLMALAAEFSGDTPQVTADVRKVVAGKMESRICLACGKKCPAGEQYRRGLDNAHYNHVLRLIKGGKATEAELMADGKLGPVGKSGPRSESSLGEYDSRQPFSVVQPTLEEDSKQIRDDLAKVLEKKSRKSQA